jgi:hypothetical protein
VVGWPFQREKGGCSVQRALWGQGLDLCTGVVWCGVVVVLVLSGEKVDFRFILEPPIPFQSLDVKRGEQTSFDMNVNTLLVM